MKLFLDTQKLFCNALDKSDRKKFDEMIDIPRFYLDFTLQPTLIQYSICQTLSTKCYYPDNLEVSNAK